MRASTASYSGFTLAMGSSPGFGPAPRDSVALFGLAVAAAPAVAALASPRGTSRRFVLQKARRHTTRDAPTDRGRAVSGTLSLPSAGVLFTIPSRYSALSVVHGIQPWEVVPPASGGIARAPPYSRSGTRAIALPPTGLSPAAAARSSGVRLGRRFVTRSGVPPSPQRRRTTPARHRSADHSAGPV